MKVEKVVVRSIESSKDRQAAVKACLLDSGVPEYLIEMYMGYETCNGVPPVVTAKLAGERGYISIRFPT